MAFGAFLAGLVIGDTEFRHQVDSTMRPFRDVLVGLFFVSIGMLFNPIIIITYPYKVLIIVLIVIFAKIIVTTLLLKVFKYSFQTALIVGCGLSQIGEFSFILASMGLELKMITRNTYNLILAGAFISIALNPNLFKISAPLLEFYKKKRKYFY